MIGSASSSSIGTKGPSNVCWSTNEMAIHGHAMDVRVPDVMETEGELDFATPLFGARPCFHSFSIFKARDWAVIEWWLMSPSSDSCGS